MRTTSEIILSLEEKIDKLLSYTSNQDLLLKTLNNKILKLEKIINDIMKEDVQLENNEVKEVISPLPQSLQDSLQVKPIQNGLKKIEIKGIKENVNFFKKEDGSYVLGKLIEENKQNPIKLENTEQKPVGYSNKSVPIQQQVLYLDDKPAAMVGVEVYRNNNLIKKIKTVTNGKWNLSLEPGDYIIKLNKKQNSSRPEINYEYTVTIPASDRVVVLDTIKF